MNTEQQWYDTGESELRLRVTLDSLSEGVILYAPDGRVAMFNATAQHILGFDPGAGTVDEIVRQRRVVDGDGARSTQRPITTRCAGRELNWTRDWSASSARTGTSRGPRP